MTLMKRAFAFAMMLCLLMVCVAPTEAMAATNYNGATQKFLIRRSGSYSSTDVWVTMKSTSKDGKTGVIVFEDTLYLTVLGTTVKIPEGTTYNYKISSLKEKGKITLTWDGNIKYAPDIRALDKLTGKIHINKSKGCDIANIWKIDTLKYNNSNNGVKVYFRND